MINTYLVIGEVLKPQGIRGEVKVRPITCAPERFQGLERVFFQNGEAYEAHALEVTRLEEDAIYMRFEGVDDRNQAEALRGTLLWIDRAHAVKLPENADFICDLIGCRGVDDAGQEWGELIDVLQPGGNDVYVFRGKRGETLVPALRSVVIRVDLAAGQILLDAARLKEVAVFDFD